MPLNSTYFHHSWRSTLVPCAPCIWPWHWLFPWTGNWLPLGSSVIYSPSQVFVWPCLPEWASIVAGRAQVWIQARGGGLKEGGWFGHPNSFIGVILGLGHNYSNRSVRRDHPIVSSINGGVKEDVDGIEYNNRGTLLSTTGGTIYPVIQRKFLVVKIVLNNIMSYCYDLLGIKENP